MDELTHKPDVTYEPQGEAPALDFTEETVAEAQRLRRIEALLFASPEPLSETVIADRVPGGPVKPLLQELSEAYKDRGVNLRQVANRWQFVTAEDCAQVLVTTQETTRKLSRPALETLAIIAYHQPCSRADIEEVRGVSVSKGSLDQLMSLGWVKMRGRRDAPGRPLLYGTTAAFLEHFDLTAIGDLPGLQDLKAQGLLEGTLPPDFDVPKPTEADDGILPLDAEEQEEAA
ncbi:SMC-Scp complex subunit ScpB [Parvularcula sp. ZS-1/3]|uniref:SMC-Scp complex subunit ScpB n=1 Tax=Parvularcula mediterranea TaxID=2732508 RepID=A0A7Y3RLJ7_9PROT|nr:SMC-Scp complex subunit ScpB [Parvularcula mediterranea]NNU16321.1 SMC-Scp complex subunit ScpB [Parvularcula mediterranea]